MRNLYGTGRLIRTAEKLFHERDWEGALKVLSAIPGSQRNRGKMLFRANLLQASGRVSEAGTAYRKLAKQFPSDLVVAVDLAEFYASSGALRRAVRAYQVALALLKQQSSAKCDQYVAVASRFSQVLHKLSRSKQAFRVLGEALVRYPGNRDILHAICSGPREAESAVRSLRGKARRE